MTVQQRELLTVWTAQLFSLAYIYYTASRRLTIIKFIATFFGVVGPAYMVPSFACTLGEDTAGCVISTWVGLILATIVTITGLMDSIYDPAGKSAVYNKMSLDLATMSRNANIRVLNDNMTVVEAKALIDEIVLRYEEVVSRAQLPWFIGPRMSSMQLMNIGLLTRINSGSATDGNSSEYTPQAPPVRITPADAAVQREISENLARLASSSARLPWDLNE